MKVLQKSSSILSLDDDLFLGQLAINLGEYLKDFDPSAGFVKKNSLPLTSKTGKSGKDRGFLEFKISFTGLPEGYGATSKTEPVPAVNNKPVSNSLSQNTNHFA